MKGVLRTDRQTDGQTFVNVESLSILKMFVHHAFIVIFEILETPMHLAFFCIYRLSVLFTLVNLPPKNRNSNPDQYEMNLHISYKM